MKYTVSALYHTLPSDLEERLTLAVKHGLAAAQSAVPIFFRADDIGVPSLSFARMAALFSKLQIPLCLAVVPSWLSVPRAAMLRQAADSTELFCWHQHGWRHVNHEKTGKKEEFGRSRPEQEIFYDIQKGHSRLTELLGDDFYHIFTPPWNRCSPPALDALNTLSFKGISRSMGASTPETLELPDYQVNIDLHTRKEHSAQEALTQLLCEIENALRSPLAGVMLHHQRMNDNAFVFLEFLLQIVSREKRLKALSFKDLAG